MKKQGLQLHRDDYEHLRMIRSKSSNLSPLTDQYHPTSNERSVSESRIFATFTDDVVVKISTLKEKYPWMHPWQVRRRLLQDLDFIDKDLPSIAGVEWILRFLSVRQPNDLLTHRQASSTQPKIFQCVSSDIESDDSDGCFIKKKPITSLTLDNCAVRSESSTPSISPSNSNSSHVITEDQKAGAKVAKKTRRQRVNFKANEVRILQQEFQRSQYPDHQEISRLAKYFKVEPCRIQIWFANRRAKQRRLNRDTHSAVDQGDSSIPPSPQSTPPKPDFLTTFQSFSSDDDEVQDIFEPMPTTSHRYHQQRDEGRVNDDSARFSFALRSIPRYLPRHSPRSSHTWPSPPRDRSCRLMR